MVLPLGSVCLGASPGTEWMGPSKSGVFLQSDARVRPGPSLEGLGILKLPKEPAPRVTRTHLGFPPSAGLAASSRSHSLRPLPRLHVGASEQTAAVLPCSERPSGHSPRAELAKRRRAAFEMSRTVIELLGTRSCWVTWCD